jgi:hypothetical protein
MSTSTLLSQSAAYVIDLLLIMKVLFLKEQCGHIEREDPSW